MPQCQLPVFFCFWFQKGRKSIFSELDGTKAKVNILPWGKRSQSTRQRGGTRGPHPLAARARACRAWECVTTLAAPCIASSPIKTPDAYTLSTRSIFHETVCSLRYHRP